MTIHPQVVDCSLRTDWVMTCSLGITVSVVFLYLNCVKTVNEPITNSMHDLKRRSKSHTSPVSNIKIVDSTMKKSNSFVGRRSPTIKMEATKCLHLDFRHSDVGWFHKMPLKFNVKSNLAILEATNSNFDHFGGPEFCFCAENCWNFPKMIGMLFK